ncbi:MAG: PstS family phosphate ABC transporter substrate-binding protein [Candidatus Binataceae bacterium]
MSIPPTDAPPPRKDIDFSLNPRILLMAVGLMVIACWLAWYFVWRPFPVDGAIPRYTKADHLSGQLVSVGSDTLADVMVLCSRGFMTIYPDVTVQLEHKGSGTAPPALIDGRSQLAPMSRPMTGEEVAAFETKYGYKPTFYRIALDALAVYVNKSNPVGGMTLQQVDGVFSSSLKRGGPLLETWGSLGLAGDWANKAITLYGRDNVSGTRQFFKEHALQNGDFKATVHEDISEYVVEYVASDPSGIGYSGIGWKTALVRAVPLGETTGHFVEPTYENALDGTYPLARFLYLYVNQQPGQPLDRLTGEFIKYVLSHEGQEAVVQAKFFPLPAKIITETLSGKN